MQENSYRIHIRQGEFELDVEGDRAFVEAYVEAFLAEEGALEPFHEAAPKGRAKSKRRAKPKSMAPRKKAEKEPREEVSADRAALKIFMKGKKVQSNKQRYLQYMRFWHARGETQVGDRHIQACYLAQSLPMPPTGRQNFGSLRTDGLVQAGTKRGFWALTPLGLESAGPAKKTRGPKASGRKGAKPAGRKKAKPAGRKKEMPAAKGARKTRKKAASKTVSPAKSPAPRKAAKKKTPRRKAPAKASPKTVPEVTPTPEAT